MRIVEEVDADALASVAAKDLAEAIGQAVAERGRACLAVSGGSTPWGMFQVLSTLSVPWDKVQLFQVDERIAPDGDPDRNWTHLGPALLDHVALPDANVHPMAVTDPDPEVAASRYSGTLREVTGDGVLDVVHLGLGPDGHTASWPPGDPVIDVADKDVAVSDVYQGRRRMTLTVPAVNRARMVLFLVRGADKVTAVRAMLDRDPGIPASRVEQDRAVLYADREALGG
jgi:6-phosphogluconolactonase